MLANQVQTQFVPSDRARKACCSIEADNRLQKIMLRLGLKVQHNRISGISLDEVIEGHPKKWFCTPELELIALYSETHDMISHSARKNEGFFCQFCCLFWQKKFKYNLENF